VDNSDALGWKMGRVLTEIRKRELLTAPA